MQISFKSDGEVQIVEVVGVIGETEAAAIKFKLEEKINDGKRKVLLDLGRYEMSIDAARAALLGIIQYLMARHVLTVACGLSLEKWPLMILPDGRQIKNFLTRLEGLNYAHATVAPDPKAHLKTLAPKNDDEAKNAALNVLLEKYEIFQHGADLDPFRLEFLAAQYKSSPNREALVTETKVREAISQIQQENADLSKECESLAAHLKQLILYRKYPLGAKEYEMKLKSLTEDKTTIQSEHAQLLVSYEKLLTDVGRTKRSSAEEVTRIETETLDLRAKLKATEDRFAAEEKNLKAQDSREQSDFEAKMKSKVKT